jgi:hypothetical protein
VKVIKQLLTAVLGSDEELAFEERLILSYVLFAALVCFISGFVNIGLMLGIGSIIIVFSSGVIYSIIFVLGRIYKKTKLAKIIFSVYTLLFCNFYWYVKLWFQRVSDVLFSGILFHNDFCVGLNRNQDYCCNYISKFTSVICS